MQGGTARRRAALALGLLCAASGLAGPARAAWDPPGVDLTRPRLLLRAADLPEIRERLGREPYQTLFRRLWSRALEAEGLPLDDPSKESHRIRSRAAKNLAFAYAVDRRVEAGGAVVPFPDAASRRAVGDRVRELLLNLFPRSRLALPEPVGGWDRDISTSEELLQYATAYDTLAGAGYDFGADEAAIVERLTDLASELYENYIDPSTNASFLTVLVHQNNHRSKSGAALMAAAVALADETPDPAQDPDGLREPSNWLAYGLDQLDLIQRWALTAGDGVYAEGPHYFQFANLNLHPVLRAWDRLVGGADWTFGPITYPSLWRHPLYARSHRWILDVSLPDGAKPPFDDAFVGRSFAFGSAPAPEDPAWAAAFRWRWENQPSPYESSGNVDLAADAIVNFDDAVAAAPPPGPRTRFYVEGGNAVLGSDWSRDAVVALVLGEHDTASQFGYDRDGLGVAPQSHEHEDPGSFLLHGFGERLAMDPGFLGVSDAGQVGRPEDHNLILADGEGPVDYLFASLTWRTTTGLDARPPADGHATLHTTLDGEFLDAVGVVSRYGAPPARFDRRFLFPDHRYLVIADVAAADAVRSFQWRFHGNGGRTSGGDYEDRPAGGRWIRPAARLDVGFAASGQAPVFRTEAGVHEIAGRERREHEVLEAQAVGARVHAVSLVYPTPTDQDPPELVDLALPGAAALRLDDPEGDRRVAVAHREVSGTSWRLPAAATGLADAESDGHLLLADTRADGDLRVLWAEGARRIAWEGQPRLSVATPGRLGVAPGDGRLDLVADNADAVVEVPALPFEPRGLDGACRISRFAGRHFVHLGRERRFTLRADAGNGRPAADPGPDRRVAPGGWVALDGTASCDPDGDGLQPRWELVSAPSGSAWELDGAEGWTPALLADRVGPYRVRLVVTDTLGLASREAEVLVVAGPLCGNGRDDDLDGWIDTDDPDCDAAAGANRAPGGEPDAFSALAGTRRLGAGSVLANDADPDGDAVTAVLAEPPRKGSVLLLADGTFVYDAPAGLSGAAGFTYRVRDAHGAESAEIAVRIDVEAPDEVSLLALGGVRWFHGGPLESGDLAILRDGRGVRALVGEGALPSAKGGETTVSFDLHRIFGPFFAGSLRWTDPALPGGALSRRTGFALLVPDGDDGVVGWALSWWPRPAVLLAWSVRDRAPAPSPEGP